MTFLKIMSFAFLLALQHHAFGGADPLKWRCETKKIIITEKMDKSNKYVITHDVETIIHNRGKVITIEDKSNSKNHKRFFYKGTYKAGPPGKPVIIYECDGGKVIITYNWEKMEIEIKYTDHNKLTMTYTQ